MESVSKKRLKEGTIVIAVARRTVLLLEYPAQEVCELVVLHQFLELPLHLLAGQHQVLFLRLVVLDALLAIMNLVLDGFHLEAEKQLGEILVMPIPANVAFVGTLIKLFEHTIV